MAQTWQQLLQEVETEAMKNLDFIISSAHTYLRILKLSDTKKSLASNIFMFLLVSQNNFKHPQLRKKLRQLAHQLASEAA